MDHLTIEGAKREIDKLNNELELYLEKKKINFERTQPSSPVLRDVIPGKSDTISVFDKFTHYVIKDEECDNKIYQILETINAYEKYIINEEKRLSKVEPDKIKIYILKQKGKTFEEIGNLVGYSKRQVIRIYNELFR